MISSKLQLPPEPLSRGLSPCSLSLTEFVEPPEKYSCERRWHVHAIPLAPVSRSCTVHVICYMCSPLFALISELNVKRTKYSSFKKEVALFFCSRNTKLPQIQKKLKNYAYNGFYKGQSLENSS